MNGFSVLMFIFGICIILCGIYLYTGHKNELLLWKTHDINKITKNELRNIGKWTIISGFVPIILGIIGLFLNI